MSASANAGNDASVPCSTPNCGFWGRPSTGNFCSRCYKEKMNETQKPTVAKAEEKVSKSEEEKVVFEEVKTVATEEKEVAAPAEEKAEVKKSEEDAVKTDVETETEAKTDTTKKRKVQKNRMRCFECRKKVGLTGIECSCGYVFCGVHRYPEDHKCDFDFKKDARERFQARTHKAAVVDKVIGEKL